MRPSFSPAIVRFLALVFILLILVQGLPFLTAFGGKPTPQTGTTYYPPQISKSSVMSFWDTLQPIITLAVLLFLARIWFLLEKISSRLERNNRMDVALTLKKDY